MTHHHNIITEDAGKCPSVVRLGSVSFFNACPLVFGLSSNPRVSLVFHVPSVLAESLCMGEVDAALVPSIDYQMAGSDDWVILPAACIASHGVVLTVRVFSRVPLEDIKHIACDSDSHTSVVLAKIIWRLKYGCVVETSPLKELTLDNTSRYECEREAVLLIGDKVISYLDDVDLWPYSLDLGEAWELLTGLPFVYACWAVGSGSSDRLDLRYLNTLLAEAKVDGLGNLDQIISQRAAGHGFTPSRARKYLTDNIRYDFCGAEQMGLECFYRLACEFGITAQNKPVRMAL